MLLKIFDLKVRFLFSPPLGRPFFSKKIAILYFFVVINFYPPKALCKAEPYGVQLIFSYVLLNPLLCLRNGFDTSKISFFHRPFKNLENVLLSGGFGWIEHLKSPSMFFILCRYIEHVYIYFCMYSKIITNILKGFKF